MKQLLSTPLLSAGLFVLWMLLARSVTPGQILLGLLLALLVPYLLRSLRPQPGPVRHPLILIRLVLQVGRDVVISALEVTWGVLRIHKRMPRSQFVVVPLELRDEHALAALSMIVMVVPGTVWSELAPDRSAVMLHVFNLDDEVTFIQHLKSRYEQPLREIFE